MKICQEFQIWLNSGIYTGTLHEDISTFYCCRQH